MRILYHHRTLGDGAEGIHIAEMVNAFRSLGHEVLLIGPAVNGSLSQQTASRLHMGVKRFLRGPFYEMLEIGYNLYGFHSVCRAIEKFKPAFIYDRYITFNYSCIAAAQKKKIPVFLEVNAPLAYERDHEADENLCFRRLAYSVERLTCKGASRTVAVSSTLKDYLVSVGVPAQQILVLPNGVNTTKFYQREKSDEVLQSLGLDGSNTLIGFVGILRPWHGVDLLLQAFRIVHAIFPKAILLLVGDGPIRSQIESLARELGVGQSLRITGRVAHEKVGEYIALFDVAVSPKATFYASPMKIIEYMAQGKAIVAPDMANVKDLVDDGVNGLLFQSGSAEALAATLIAALSDDNLRFKLGKAALIETSRRLNWPANASRVIKEYERLI